MICSCTDLFEIDAHMQLPLHETQGVKAARATGAGSACCNCSHVQEQLHGQTNMLYAATAKNGRQVLQEKCNLAAGTLE